MRKLARVWVLMAPSLGQGGRSLGSGAARTSRERGGSVMACPSLEEAPGRGIKPHTPHLGHRWRTELRPSTIENMTLKRGRESDLTAPPQEPGGGVET